MTSNLQADYNRFKAEIQELQEKIMELEDDADQHRKVLALLPTVDKDRRCKRMIGNVLVDKTVGDVIPALEETLTGLEKALGTLKENLQMRERLMEDWKFRNKVKVVSA